MKQFRRRRQRQRWWQLQNCQFLRSDWPYIIISLQFFKRLFKNCWWQKMSWRRVFV